MKAARALIVSIGIGLGSFTVVSCGGGGSPAGDAPSIVIESWKAPAQFLPGESAGFSLSRSLPKGVTLTWSLQEPLGGTITSQYDQTVILRTSGVPGTYHLFAGTSNGRSASIVFVIKADSFQYANSIFPVDSFNGGISPYDGVPMFPQTALLGDGKTVLISRGAGWLFDTTADKYLGAKSSTALTPVTPRIGGTATLLTAGLDAGKVLICGGQQQLGGMANFAELFDPLTNTYSALPGLPTGPRQGFTATLLQDGKRVLVCGGFEYSQISSGYSSLSSTYIFDGDTNDWIQGPTLLTSRYLHGAILLADGRVLVAGGEYEFHYFADELPPVIHDLASLELLDIYTNSAVTGPNLDQALQLPVMAPLADGTVLIAGGRSYTSGPTLNYYTTPAASYRFDPQGNSNQGAMTTVGSMSGGHELGTFCVRSDGSIIVYGGYFWNPTYNTAVEQNNIDLFKDGVWTTLAPDSSIGQVPSGAVQSIYFPKSGVSPEHLWIFAPVGSGEYTNVLYF